MNLKPAAFLTPLLLLASGALAQPATYPILLTRPDKPNTAFDIHLTLDRSTTRTITDGSAPGQLTVPQVDAIRADLTGRFAIQKVNADGMPALMTITIKTFTNTDTQLQLIPADTIITITRGGANSPTTATLPDGSSISPEALTIIATWYSPDANPPSDDATFGSKTPRAVGDSWKAQPQAIIEGLKISGVTAKPEDIDGSATLKSIDKTAAGPVLHVTMNLTAKNFRPLSIPADVIIDTAQTKMIYEKTLPQDPAGPNLGDNLTIDMTLKMHSGTRNVAITSHSLNTGTYTPIK